jgi:hypothetical protein
MKKTWKIMFALTLALVLLAGCIAAPTEQILAKTERYSVVDNGGSYSLRFYDQSSGNASSGANMSVKPEEFLFSSLGEMKAAVLEGKFTDQQMQYIGTHFSKNEKGDVLLFDMDNLCDISLPEGAEVTQISWKGKNYTFSFKTKDFTGDLMVCEKSSMESYAAKNDVARKQEKIVKTEEDPAHNGKIYYVEGGVGVRKHTQHTYSRENGMITVCVCDKVSDLSLAIRFWGEYNGVYFYGAIMDAHEAPSYEWFQNFGLKPFVEEKP